MNVSEGFAMSAKKPKVLSAKSLDWDSARPWDEKRHASAAKLRGQIEDLALIALLRENETPRQRKRRQTARGKSHG